MGNVAIARSCVTSVLLSEEARGACIVWLYQHWWGSIKVTSCITFRGFAWCGTLRLEPEAATCTQGLKRRRRRQRRQLDGQLAELVPQNRCLRYCSHRRCYLECAKGDHPTH